jgi:hypothetical protein
MAGWRWRRSGASKGASGVYIVPCSRMCNSNVEIPLSNPPFVPNCLRLLPLVEWFLSGLDWFRGHGMPGAGLDDAEIFPGPPQRPQGFNPVCS